MSVGSQKSNTKHDINIINNGSDTKLNGPEDSLTNSDEGYPIGDELYDESDDEKKLHGYDKISNGCAQTIQLENQDKKEPLHWQIPLSRRFRALKLWFVLRNYGVAGLQKHIRESVRLAQKFEALVLADQRFEVPQPRNLGMVVFRLKGDNTLTECLLKRLNARGYIHAVPACFKGVYVIRFTVTSQRTTNQDILDDWNEIKTVASEILMDMYGTENGNIVTHKKPRISLKETRELNATFGTSLLLANSPMSPKIVNGTHVAICDYEQVLSSCAQTFAQLKMEPKDSPEMRRRIRGMRICGKKFSLDSYMDMVQGLMVEQSLPQCSEEEREDASNGSSDPGERSSISSSPVTSSLTIKQDNNTDNQPPNQLLVPATLSRQFRSKSFGISLPDLQLDEATVSIDMKNNEITITPTGSKKIDDQVRFNAVEDKLNIGDRISQAFDNFQGALLERNDASDKVADKSDDSNSKLTIKGPGSYIKKLIQQFSEGPFESEETNAEVEKAVTTQTIKDRADAICKKCFHYKGRINK